MDFGQNALVAVYSKYLDIG